MKKLTNKIIEDICQNYINGINSPELSKIFNLSNSKILRILEKNNIKRRSIAQSNIKYSLNNDYFSIIDSEDKAYFLGLFTADGCVGKKLNTIALQKEDEYILKKFNFFINSNRPLKNINPQCKNCKPQVRLEINSFKIKTDFIKLGVIPNKSHKTYFPEIPEHLWSHFIRGVFDGDGCISYSYSKFKTKNGINKYKSMRFKIIGNINLIQKIQEILIEKCKISKNNLYIDGKHYKIKKENIVSVIYEGNLQVNKIYTYLYKDATIFLTRKYEKFIHKNT